MPRCTRLGWHAIPSGPMGDWTGSLIIGLMITTPRKRPSWARLAPFDGVEIIDIICRQPATARFIARHFYNFFVADEPQVPAWQTVPPHDPEAIQTLMEAFIAHEYDIRAVMRVLFNADFFKQAQFAKVKSPAELVVGTARLAGGHRFPDVDDITASAGDWLYGATIAGPTERRGLAHRVGMDQ